MKINGNKGICVFKKIDVSKFWKKFQSAKKFISELF
jgi:hypothetical protein